MHGVDEAHTRITIVGGGLAGCEATWQLARRGIPVTLVEMKRHKRTPAQNSDELAELVCSNSFRSSNPENAIGLLHEELRRMGSLILEAADESRVPAGDALAVDRTIFAATVERRIRALPGVVVEEREFEALPEGPGLAVIATGPLTSDALARSIEAASGEGRLAFYDAIAPIVTAESVDPTIAFAQSRHGKGGGDDYLNLPLNEEEYRNFVQELCTGKKVEPHAFEEVKYFEGCLPIEVIAERGIDTLRHGPMKPMGLVDPRTGERPYAVVQLRREDKAGTSYNLVGFQTRLTWPEQRRIFRTLPGLAEAEFLRLGQIHRNTFLDAPTLLAPDFSLRGSPHLFFAGQIVGVEGYVESCAVGLLVAGAVLARLQGRPFAPPPAESALGALQRHAIGADRPEGHVYQPSNITWGLFPPLEQRAPKAKRRALQVERARAALARWLDDEACPFPPAGRKAEAPALVPGEAGPDGPAKEKIA